MIRLDRGGDILRADPQLIWTMAEPAERPQNRFNHVVDRFVRLARYQDALRLSLGCQPMHESRNKLCLSRAGRSLRQTQYPNQTIICQVQSPQVIVSPK